MRRLGSCASKAARPPSFARTCRAAPIADIDEPERSRILSVNLTGVFLCMKYEIPAMKRQGAGAIINTASVGQTPIGRIASPAEIAQTVLFLASADAFFMVSHALIADGGLTAQ